MRKISLGIILLILVSGCGRTDNAQNLPPTPSHAPIKPVVPTLTDIPGGPEAENLFIATLQRAGIRFSDRDKTIGMGRTVCASLQTNAVLGVAANTQSLDHISDRLTKGTEFSADQAGVIIGASIGAFCPEFSYLGN